jgi:hypothetical protein
LAAPEAGALPEDNCIVPEFSNRDMPFNAKKLAGFRRPATPSQLIPGPDFHIQDAACLAT